MTTWFDDQTPKRRRQPLLHTFSLVSGKNEAVFFFFSFFFARPRGRRWMRSDVPKQPAESRKMATYLPTFLFFIHSMNVRGKKNYVSRSSSKRAFTSIPPMPPGLEGGQDLAPSLVRNDVTLVFFCVFVCTANERAEMLLE